MYVQTRASANSKRVQVKSIFSTVVCAFVEILFLLLIKNIHIHYSLQTNVDAKNHAVVMPDAKNDATLNALISAGFGSAVQRYSAISAVIFVGGSKFWYILIICLVFIYYCGYILYCKIITSSSWWGD